MEQPASSSGSDRSAEYNVQNTEQLLNRAAHMLGNATPVCSPNEPKIPFESPYKQDGSIEDDTEKSQGDNNKEKERDDNDIHPLDSLYSQLQSYGLSDADIERARRWNQPPIQESRDVHHLRILRDLAQHLPENSTKSPIQLLESAFLDAQRKSYDSSEESSNIPPSYSAFERAQIASNAVLLELVRHDDVSTEELTFFNDLTKGGPETYDAVAQFCEKKLSDLIDLRIEQEVTNSMEIFRASLHRPDWTNKNCLKRCRRNRPRIRIQNTSRQEDDALTGTSVYKGERSGRVEEVEDEGLG